MLSPSAALFVLIAFRVSTTTVATEDACSGTRLYCLFTRDAVNCSASAAAEAAAAAAFSDDEDDNSEVATFVQSAPSYQPSLVQLHLSPTAGSDLDSFDVVNLAELVRCFGLTYRVSLTLAIGNAQCRLRPGSLAAFAGMHRLTLRLRFSRDSISGGLFDASLARLQNLQLESPTVTAVEPGAFAELRELSRLSISNLRVSYLSSGVLRGLGKLRFLELPGNSLARLDAASFASTPRLESIDLRTVSGPPTVDLAVGTFCNLTVLELLQYSKGLEALNCSHFASRQLHLSLSLGHAGESEPISCERLLGESTACTGGSSAGVRVATTKQSPTTTKTASTSTTTSTTATSKPPAKPTPSTSVSSSLSSSPSPPSTSLSPASTASSQSGQALVTPNKQATATNSGAGAAVAVVIVLLVVAAAAIGVGLFVVRRRRSGVLHRAASRQPIFSAGGLDLQESVWNPAFSGGSVEAEIPEPIEGSPPPPPAEE